MSDYSDLEQEFHSIAQRCRNATMTSIERLYSLYKAVGYIVRSRIPGDIVECGVWQGGSMMCAALSLLQFGDTSRQLFLYDTYEGMPSPESIDVDLTGTRAIDILHTIRCEAPIEIVKNNMESTGYPENKFVYIKGKVEETIPETAPDKIAILRLDTDWYSSTRHELAELYPRLSPGGVLIIDDYGHWRGAKLAVDEYFAEQKDTILLNRIDYTGRIGVKTAYRSS